jgi:ATP-dependent Lhr-like helicase
LTKGEKTISAWYKQKKWIPFRFQKEVMQAYLAGKSGLLNAPTGSGKTYALWLPVLAEFLDQRKKTAKPGLQVLWITPLRALAQDIRQAMQNASDEMGIGWRVECRTGDTTSSQKQKQKTKPPEALVTTPESLQLLLSQKGYHQYLGTVKTIVIDEWHELLGNKRGVQIELSISRIRSLQPSLRVWGISATIGNMDLAMKVLLGNNFDEQNAAMVISDIEKKIKIETVIPEEIDRFPWAGHLGISLLPQIVSIIESGNTTLIFTNTRSQTEIWYQHILFVAPHLSGAIAMHHGSLDMETRTWVEQSLHSGVLKAVVCTSTLDLGVDFHPVDIVIQIGGPKGIARFLQRAGRSGHRPGEESKVYFVPTNTLELVEAAALKEAVQKKIVESKSPLELSLDVLVQYVVTLAVSEGFREVELYKEVIQTYSYRNLTLDQWYWILLFVTEGGESLQRYDEYRKVDIINGVYKVQNKRIAMHHRLSIGTIVGDPALKVQYMSGKNIGTVEESFVTNLKVGDVFWFAGRNLEFVRVKDLTVLVRSSDKKRGIVPRWAGGRMPLSSQLSQLIREKLNEANNGQPKDIEIIALKDLFALQKKWSAIPSPTQLLVEKIESKEGYHIFFYPFEGRLVHQVLAAMVALRISRIEANTFSIAMNDYGFELLSDKPIPIEEALEQDLFSIKNYVEDIREGINQGEMARRKFRDIAIISGLVFQGFPGKYVSSKHLQSSTQLFFDVFEKYDPHNLLYLQSFQEAITQQLEFARLKESIERIFSQQIILLSPPRFTPFAFPIMADRLRESMSTETVESRLERIKEQLEKLADKK